MTRSAKLTLKSFALFVMGVVVTPSVFGQTSYPMLMSLHPTAAQVGKTSEHTIKSRYSMDGAFKVLVTGKGVRGEIVPPDPKAKKSSGTSLRIKFHVDAGSRPGIRDFRIATPRGVSTLGQLVITTPAVTQEASKNDQADTAQVVSVPGTICGAIEKAEDVDFFRFSAKKGQSLSFHVLAMRLQDRIHDLQKHVDPILTLRNATGVTLASSDNAFFADPFIAHTFSADGDYLLEIRDVRYQGNGFWEYAIEVTDQPFVQTVFPIAVPQGKPTVVSPVGFHFGQSDPTSTLHLEKDGALGPRPVVLKWGKQLSNPINVVVSDEVLQMETKEKNDTQEQAQKVNIPGGVNGRIDGEGDLDYYRFEAKKGEAYSIEVLARRVQSRLDSHLRILDDKGKQLQLSDDLRLGKRSFADSWIENWKAPRDGVFFLEIRDLHLRGGAEYTYFINMKKAVPTFELYADTDKTQLTPGTSGVIFVRAERKNGFAGEIQLAVADLPAGVTASCGKILEGAKDGCIVLEAAKDAKLDAANIVISGQAAPMPDDQSALTQVACNYQETYQPGGGRGHWPVAMHTVGIGEPSDITAVELSTYDIQLKPGQSQAVDVKIIRKSGFKANVTLDVIYKHLSSVYGNSLPAGVTIDGNASKTLLTNGATAGKIVFKAAANAKPAKEQQIAVMANVSLNFVMKATYSSRPVKVTVTK